MLLTQSEAAQKTQELKSLNKTVALTIAFYDMLSVRHVKLFKFVKQHADYLVVGVEQDASAKINISGGTRPIDKLEHRVEMLNELKSVDFIFVMEHVIDFKKQSAPAIYKDLFKQINPTHLITNITTDKFAKQKEQFAKELGIEFVGSSDTSHLE